MDVELSPHHDELISALYDLRVRMPGMSRDERLIVEMAIMMLEYLDEYVIDVADSDGMNWTREQQEEYRKKVEAVRRRWRIQWTFDDFERLICSGGFEMTQGHLVPRF